MSSLISFKSEFPGAGWATWALGAANLLQTRSHHIRPNALTSPPPPTPLLVSVSYWEQ